MEQVGRGTLFSPLSLLAKGLPTSPLLHPPCSPYLLSERKDCKHCRNTVLFPHLTIFTTLCTSQDKLVPQGLRVSHIHLCTSQLLFCPWLLLLSSVAEQRCLWKALLHLKGSSNKQSNFRPMTLAPNELLIVFPWSHCMMLYSSEHRHMGAFWGGS